MMTKYVVVQNRDDNCFLPIQDILYEVNRDRTNEGQNYTVQDWLDNPVEVSNWLDPQYYAVTILEENAR